MFVNSKIDFMKKHLFFAVIAFFAIAMTSISCEKNKEKDEDSIVCGGDSCLVHECKNHPTDLWKWEHCYDFTLRDNKLVSLSGTKYYYRENSASMSATEQSFRFVYGAYTERILHEYDIWNRK